MKILKIFCCLIFFFGLSNATVSQDDFLDSIERSAFLFFWEQADNFTGLVKDRAYANGGNDNRPVASIASTGFGLTALTIAHNRNYFDRSQIFNRINNTLNFILNGLDGYNGFYYHFVDLRTGKRVWNCELSSIDTAILMNGVLSVKGYFSENEYIQNITKTIYEKVDYNWMKNGQNVLTMGWKPESGFLTYKWSVYCELLMLVLQAIGSPTHPIPASDWNAFRRDKFTYKNYTYISAPGGRVPLFVHQYSHAWFDFNNKKDNYSNYFENSVIATKAHKLWSVTNLKVNFPNYNELFWGITASDSLSGYQAWGGPPTVGSVDGSIVPCAAGGSIPFLPDETIAVLRNIKDNFPNAWQRYGFVDVFNPLKNWYNKDVIGIDVGITMLMAENYRTGFVWNTFKKNSYVVNAMKMVGFKDY